MDTTAIPGPEHPAARARTSTRPGVTLALGWTLPGVVFGGYGAAHDIAAWHALASPGAAPAGCAGPTCGSSPPVTRWRMAAWLAAVAAGAAVDVGWFTLGTHPGTQPGQLLWSPLIMFLGHLGVGAAMLAVLRAGYSPAVAGHCHRGTSRSGCS